MLIFVLGGESKVMREVSKNFPIHTFDFIDEIESLELIEGSLICNGKNLSKANGIILNSSSMTFNYLWNELSYIPFFSPPFGIRNSSNHNFYFTISEGCGFKSPETIPSLSGGKVSVTRNFPPGQEIKLLLYGEKIVEVEGKPVLSIPLVRRLRKFLRCLGVKVGVVTLIYTKNEVYLKEFSPLPCWDSLPKKAVSDYLEWVLTYCRALHIGRR